jgi:amidophosphoribosyltransferase
MVRSAGAREVHVRISSPPTRGPCYYGIDTPEASELLAANHEIEEIRKLIGADSLSYVSMDGLYRAMGETGRNNEAPQYCDACFSGEYPIARTDMEHADDVTQMSLRAELA